MEKASAAAAVGAAGVGPAAPEYHADKLRDAKFIRELALNPYNWKDSVPIKPGEPSHRVIAATMHGSAPSAGTTYNPAYVPPNMIVIMTTAGPEETIGQQIYVTPSLYNNILPETFKGHYKEKVAAIPGFFPEHDRPLPPNIVNLMDGMLGLDDESPQYKYFFYATEGEEVPNRVLTLRPQDIELPFAPLASFGKFYTFGIEELYSFPSKPITDPKIVPDFDVRFVNSNVQDVIMNKPYSGRCTVADVLKLISDTYHPTRDLPVIVYLVSCDVQHKKYKRPHPKYIQALLRISRYTIKPHDIEPHSKKKPVRNVSVVDKNNAEAAYSEIFSIPLFAMYAPSPAELTRNEEGMFFSAGNPKHHHPKEYVKEQLSRYFDPSRNGREAPNSSSRNGRDAVSSRNGREAPYGPSRNGRGAVSSRNGREAPYGDPSRNGPGAPNSPSRYAGPPLPTEVSVDLRKAMKVKLDGGRLKTQRRTRKRCRRSKKHRRIGSRKA